MIVHFCGTGTPELDLSRQHSSLVVECGSSRLLFDAGRGITTQLLRLGKTPMQVESVFITHHHYDHICDLGEFILANWHNGRMAPLNIYGPHGTAKIVAAWLDQIYYRDILFTLRADSDMTDIHEMVHVTDITPGWTCSSMTWSVTAGAVDHGSVLGLSFDEWPCLGYRLECEGKTIGISGDAVESPALLTLVKEADLLVQCCHQKGDAASDSQTIIASARQAGRIADQAGVKKLALTHVPPQSENQLMILLAEAKEEFGGEVLLAEDLLLVEV